MISIIIPIRNEEPYIEKCLESIFNQDYPLDQIEILIADGMSTDRTRTIIQEYQKEYTNIQLIDNPGEIVPTGINAAFRQSRGDIIIRIDGHTIVSSDYIHKCVETLQRTGADNVGGLMTAEGSTAFGKTVAIATSIPFGIGNSKFHYSKKEEQVDSVYMGAWPRQVFVKIGLFDEELVRDQDDEFNYRLKKFGGKIILNPMIKSIYTVRSNPSALLKQYFQYGLWKVRVLQKHPKQMSLRQFIPPLFVFSLLVSLILSCFSLYGNLLLLFLIGSYLVANLTASYYTAVTKGLKHFPLLPAIFAIIHVGYGSGFLVGLVKFWNRWRDKIGKVPMILR